MSSLLIWRVLTWLSLAIASICWWLAQRWSTLWSTRVKVAEAAVLASWWLSWRVLWLAHRWALRWHARHSWSRLHLMLQTLPHWVLSSVSRWIPWLLRIGWRHSRLLSIRIWHARCWHCRLTVRGCSLRVCWSHSRHSRNCWHPWHLWNRWHTWHSSWLLSIWVHRWLSAISTHGGLLHLSLHLCLHLLLDLRLLLMMLRSLNLLVLLMHHIEHLLLSLSLNGIFQCSISTIWSSCLLLINPFCYD